MTKFGNHELVSPNGKSPVPVVDPSVDDPFVVLVLPLVGDVSLADF